MEQVESLPVGIAARGLLQLSPDMTGDPLEIGHQSFRVTEDEVIDALEDKLFPSPVVVRFHKISVVDVPDLEELRAGEIAFDGELGKNLLDIMLCQDALPSARILSG
jgi:hypothetical protein